MSKNKIPNDIDIHVSRQIRLARLELKLTQQQVGDKLGLTFQQIQKYETGVNRVSAGRLMKFAQLFGCKPCDFFPEDVHISKTGAQDSNSDLSTLRKTILTSISKIDDVRHLKAIETMMSVMAEH